MEQFYLSGFLNCYELGVNGGSQKQAINKVPGEREKETLSYL